MKEVNYMKIISIRENPEFMKQAIQYFQSKWNKHNTKMVWEDCIKNCVNSDSLLPQWYLLIDNNKILGCAGLIPNDFISRMDLIPWLCSLYIEEEFRGNKYSYMLVEHIEKEAKKLGFSYLYLCTEHIGFYEKLGFEFVGIGYHLWGNKSRIYKISI